LVPVVIDASVLVYGLVALVLRARGRSSAWAWILMLGFTVVSIGANAAHAYDVGPELRTIVGVVLVALAPLSVLTSTHALASLVVADGPVTEPEHARVEAEPVAAERVPEQLEVTAPAPAEPAPAPVAASVAAEPAPRRPRLGRVQPGQETLPAVGMGVTACAAPICVRATCRGAGCSAPPAHGTSTATCRGSPIPTWSPRVTYSRWHACAPAVPCGRSARSTS